MYLCYEFLPTLIAIAMCSYTISSDNNGNVDFIINTDRMTTNIANVYKHQ